MGGAPGGGRDLPVVGLRREREVLSVALDTGRHVVIEGPPGTGKSTLLRAIARDAGRQVVFVEGNAELTPARLVGQHDPARVLAEGYVPDAFTDGPLLAAMRGGGLLYLEELNRVPEETLNVLITVLAEGEIAVPRLGAVRAAPGFRIVAAMNPFDAVGTARVSQAVADRMCRVVLGYQDEAAEQAITRTVTGADGPAVGLAVALARATRTHPDVRMGSSVRGAIDGVHLLLGLARLRGEDPPGPETVRDAAYAALSGRIRVADGSDRTPESILDELLAALAPAEPDGRGKADRPPEAGGPDPAAGGSPPGGRSRPGGDSRPGGRESRSSLRRDRGGGPQRGTLGRQRLAARHAAFGSVSPAVGELDEQALGALLDRDPEAAAALLADLAVATDEALRVAARRLAGRVFLRVARAAGPRTRGVRRLAPGRGAGDLDLDRTLDRAAAWPPAAEDVRTTGWTGHRRSVCLAVDRSGSMSGAAVALGAVAAAAVVLAADGRTRPAVLAFTDRVTVLQRPAAPRPPAALVGELVALRGHGTTDLAGALRAASAQLAGTPADERVVLLLSDCLRTAGGDPAAALAGIDRLHVLCPQPGGRAGPEGLAAATALAARGRGSCVPVRGLTDLPAALATLLG